MTHDNKKMNNNLFRRPLIHLACPMLLAIVAVVVAAAAAAVPSVEAVFHTLPRYLIMFSKREDVISYYHPRVTATMMTH